MRHGCYDCVRKHLAQALVLMCEVEKGYPTHGWLAVGHMAEAEDESIRLSKDLTTLIREERLRYMQYLNDGQEYVGDLLQLIEHVTEMFASLDDPITPPPEDTHGEADDPALP